MLARRSATYLGCRHLTCLKLSRDRWNRPSWGTQGSSWMLSTFATIAEPCFCDQIRPALEKAIIIMDCCIDPPPPPLIWSAQHILLILGKRNEASRIYRFVDSRFWARINTFVDSSIWLFKEHKILSWFAPQLSLWPLLFYFFPPDNCALIL